jgi:hypothetical protein
MVRCTTLKNIGLIFTLAVSSAAAFSYEGLEEVYSSGRGRDDLYIIICNDDLYDYIEYWAGSNNDLTEYIDQLEDEGYDVDLYLVSENLSPETLRDALAYGYSQEGYYHLLFIGELPTVEFECIATNPYKRWVFPFDYFYCELDGDWEDNLDEKGEPGSNGIYDTYSLGFENIDLDIAFGRWSSESLRYWPPGEPVLSVGGLVMKYIEKNMEYRISGTDIPARALNYKDDTHAAFMSDEVEDILSEIYNSVITVDDEWTTWATNYEDHIAGDMAGGGYEWVDLGAHGAPCSNVFYRDDDTSSTSYLDLWAIDGPEVHFYFNRGCITHKYTHEDYVAGWYIFKPASAGLATYGNTDVNGWGLYEDFYDAIADGETLGEAVRLQGVQPFSSYSAIALSRTLIGDPTLKISEYMPANRVISDTGSVEPALTESAIRLSKPFPNPAASSVTFEFELPETSGGSLEIYDIKGRCIEELYVDEDCRQITWDLSDRSGAPVAGGIFFARIVADEVSEVKKLVVIR